MKKSGFFSMRAGKFARTGRDNWRKLIPKQGWKPVKRVVRRAAAAQAEPEGKAWRPAADEPRKYPVTDSKTGRTIVFDNRESAMVLIQEGIDAVFDSWWQEMDKNNSSE